MQFMGASLPRATRTCCARGREVVREVDLGRLVEGRSRRRGSQAGDEGRVVEFGLPHRLGGLGRNSVARQQPKPRVRRQGLPRGEAEARARRRGPGVRVGVLRLAVEIARARVGDGRAARRAPRTKRSSTLRWNRYSAAGTDVGEHVRASVIQTLLALSFGTSGAIARIPRPQTGRGRRAAPPTPSRSRLPARGPPTARRASARSRRRRRRAPDSRPAAPSPPTARCASARSRRALEDAQ